MQNQTITAAPAANEPDYKEIRQELINRMGVDAYLDSFSRHLKTEPLGDSERFEIYYRTRCEIKTDN